VAGIAYAKDAVRWLAHRSESEHGDALVEAWSDWELHYWTPERIKVIKDFIKGERKREQGY
jgi:hypothetical protein